jgi:hypothetical protein
MCPRGTYTTGVRLSPWQTCHLGGQGDGNNTLAASSDTTLDDIYANARSTLDYDYPFVTLYAISSFLTMYGVSSIVTVYDLISSFVTIYEKSSFV